MKSIEIDYLIETILIICSSRPTNNSERAFKLFHNWLVNPQNHKENEIIARNFAYNKDTVYQLGIDYYLESKNLKTLAISYALYFLYNFPGVTIKDLTQNQDEKMQAIEWHDRKSLKN